MKGQMNITNLLYTVVLVIVLTAMMPIIYNQINTLLATVSDPIQRIIVQLIPLGVYVAVLSTIIAWGSPGGYYSR